MTQRNDGSSADCSDDSELLRVVFQGKWRLRILRELMSGPVRLSELRRLVPACSKKMIIDTLHGLEGLGWVERREFPTRVKKVEYRLTGECERELKRVLLELTKRQL